MGSQKRVHGSVDVFGSAPDDVIGIRNRPRKRKHFADLRIQRKEGEKSGPEIRPGGGLVGRPSFHLEDADLGFAAETRFGELAQDFLRGLDGKENFIHTPYEIPEILQAIGRHGRELDVLATDINGSSVGLRSKIGHDAKSKESKSSNERGGESGSNSAANQCKVRQRLAFYCTLLLLYT
jgi:hypothetical protein